MQKVKAGQTGFWILPVNMLVDDRSGWVNDKRTRNDNCKKQFGQPSPDPVVGEVDRLLKNITSRLMACWRFSPSNRCLSPG